MYASMRLHRPYAAAITLVVTLLAVMLLAGTAHAEPTTARAGALVVPATYQLDPLHYLTLDHSGHGSVASTVMCFRAPCPPPEVAISWTYDDQDKTLALRHGDSVQTWTIVKPMLANGHAVLVKFKDETDDARVFPPVGPAIDPAGHTWTMTFAGRPE
ncbi:hypothetical protein AMAG_05126 [Allomyces macrogynus ATCC 38327]|uniref:von Hippel-Lindau disease tumour suppressor beta domain-containing protein n=1 Tax=Allomyces macrogynus (strain ATCC 38327) TaxID=578462 RepID=A0A0L0SB42_ALLM3|nr:hypothetical protein AMAG_05126 [Allomyces macrogynus ATCC 38327]|eukprot:KNE59652.1 hypothetical protein AMAG_05126 [Allomyces macrogynus ATCC 38327]